MLDNYFLLILPFISDFEQEIKHIPVLAGGRNIYIPYNREEIQTADGFAYGKAQDVVVLTVVKDRLLKNQRGEKGILEVTVLAESGIELYDGAGLGVSEPQTIFLETGKSVPLGERDVTSTVYMIDVKPC